MAGNLSNYAENKILEILRGTAFTGVTPFVALFTSDPTDGATGTEVAGNGYARKSVTFGAASNGAMANNADVLFDAATGSWGTVSHIGIYDGATAGNLIWHGSLTASKTVASGDQFKIASGALTLSID